MEEILPLGSVVSLKDKKDIMVAGYGPASFEDEQQYDYFGIYAKYGLIKSENLKLGRDYVYFNNSDIDKVLFMGCQDNEMKKYINMYTFIRDNKDAVKNVMQEVKEEKNEEWDFTNRNSCKCW